MQNLNGFDQAQAAPRSRVPRRSAAAAADAAAAATATGRRASSAERLQLLQELLTPDEQSLIVASLHDGASAGELADAGDVHQTTISYRLRRVLAKLAAAGIRPAAATRPRDRRHGPGRLKFVEPGAMDRLTVTDRASCGRVVARWEPNQHPQDRPPQDDRPPRGNRARTPAALADPTADDVDLVDAPPTTDDQADDAPPPSPQPTRPARRIRAASPAVELPAIAAADVVERLAA